MKNTIIKVPVDACTGCGACYNKCPVDAIEMHLDKEGFLRPIINEKKCIDCGICYNICPVISPVEQNKSPKSYAVWANDEIRLKSSSGGMFSLLANAIFDEGGVVCGARYSDDYLSVYHAWAKNEKELSFLRGSKYVQSDIGKTFKEAKDYLDKGIPVLYTGTPCQIAGIKNYLKKDYDNLILVDIVCHGVPSPKVYRSYLKEKAGNSSIEKMDFREKAYWGWGTATSLFMKDGSIYRENCFKDPYWVGFLSGLITRKCCSKCPYTQLNRVGDFTIGDFWGVKDIMARCDDAKGTSLVLVNNKKAKNIFEKIKGNCALLEQIDIKKVEEGAKTRNGQLLHPTKANNRREKFFNLFINDEMNFVDCFNRSQRYDVGYVGWWDSMNYGSALTSFAMNRTLKRMGKTVIMLEHGGIIPGANDYGLEFARHFYDCSKITDTKDFGRFNGVCDTFLVGSDQLWNWWNIKNNHMEFFFLNFVHPGHKRISYATSFGMDSTDFPEDRRIRVSYHLSKFDAISVREKSGVDICKNEFNVEATHVLDPVFLCDMDSYNEILSLSKVKEHKEYLFSYILDPTEDKIQMVKETAKSLGLPYRIAIDALRDNDAYSREVTEKLLRDDPNVLINLRIEDWLKYIANASYVTTDSFHGFCFSLIFNKQVIAYINSRRGKARFDSIAETTGLENRLITASSQIIERNLIGSKIDYSVVNQRLANERKRSQKWLKNALDKPIRKTSASELLLWKCIEHDRAIYEANLGQMKKTMEMLQKRIEELEKKQ